MIFDIKREVGIAKSPKSQHRDSHNTNVDFLQNKQEITSLRQEIITKVAHFRNRQIRRVIAHKTMCEISWTLLRSTLTINMYMYYWAYSFAGPRTNW